MTDRTFDPASRILKRQASRDIAILVLTVIACAVPFLSQPFHMDDFFYMDMARNAQQKPLFPYDTPYSLQGESAADIGSHSHPPLQTYFLAIILRFFGEGAGKEWIYHSFALFYPILAVIALYFLSARFVERPLWPSIVLACSPLFLVMQHTLMTDVPTLAFWLGAICCFLWAADRKSTGLYAASSFFQMSAMFMSYQSFALTPLLGFYQLRKGKGAKGWVSLVFAPAMIGAWFALNYFHYHRMLLGATLGFVQSRHPLSPHVLGTKLLAILGYQGWLVIFPFFVFYVYARGLKGRALALVLLAAAFLAQLSVSEYSIVDKGIFVIGVAAGVFIISRMGIIAWNALHSDRGSLGFEKADEQFISLWYFGVLAYCLFLLTEGSARYILPLVPPFLICYFRTLEMLETSEYRLPRRLLNSAMLASGSLVVSLVWGLALSEADQEFARIYPRAASEFSRVTGGMESYFVGEWGFRYYFGRAGARLLPIDVSTVRGGSFLASPKLALPYEFPADLRSMTMPFQTLAYETKTPLRIFDWRTPAGFYSSGWGLNPFSLSRAALEEIEIRQVNFMIERLPWAQVETPAAAKPWPGYLTIQGQSLLAILSKPGTRIVYSWPVRQSAILELQCGVSPDAYVGGVDTTFDFEIRQLGTDGRILSGFNRTIRPGIDKNDRGWLAARLPLRITNQGALEFRYTCTGKEMAGTGAFAQALLRPAE